MSFIFEQGNVKDSELPREILNIIGTKHVFQVKMSSYFETPRSEGLV
jgi:hypothetical protein